jgi:hypothetical protein
MNRPYHLPAPRRADNDSLPAEPSPGSVVVDEARGLVAGRKAYEVWLLTLGAGRVSWEKLSPYERRAWTLVATIAHAHLK